MRLRRDFEPHTARTIRSAGSRSGPCRPLTASHLRVRAFESFSNRNTSRPRSRVGSRGLRRSAGSSWNAADAAASPRFCSAVSATGWGTRPRPVPNARHGDCAPDLRPGSDAEPLRNSLIRRGNSIRQGDWRYRVLLWIRRLKVRILPPQPTSLACGECQSTCAIGPRRRVVRHCWTRWPAGVVAGEGADGAAGWRTDHGR